MSKIEITQAWEYKNPDKEVMVMQIIRTTNLRRGDGTDANPIRAITQYWSMDGDLLAERDPFFAHVAPTSSGSAEAPR